MEFNLLMSNKYPNIDGLMFDMDDTLIENGVFVLNSFDYFLADFGVKLSDDEKKLVMGRTLEETVYRIGEKYDIRFPHITEISRLMFKTEFELIKQNILSLNQSLLNILDEAKSEGIKIGVVTSSYKYRANEILSYFGLLSPNGSNYVDVVVTREDVTNPKPHSEPFSQAANFLKLNPSKCIAFDDSKDGIISAKTAGMYAAFKTKNSLGRDLFKQELGPEMFFNSFDELTLYKLDWAVSYFGGHEL